MKEFITKHFILDTLYEFAVRNFSNSKNTVGDVQYRFKKYINAFDCKLKGEPFNIAYDVNYETILIFYVRELPKTIIYPKQLSDAFFNKDMEISQYDLEKITTWDDIRESLGVGEPRYESINYFMNDGFLCKSLDSTIDYSDFKITEKIIEKISLEDIFSYHFCEEILKQQLPDLIEFDFVSRIVEKYTRVTLENEIAVAEMIVTELLDKYSTEEEVMEYLYRFHQDKTQLKLDI